METSKDIPAVYWRKSKVGNCERIPSMYAGDWYTAVMNAHIFTEDIAVSNAIASMMCTKLNQKKVLQFPEEHGCVLIITINFSLELMN